jgi:hypothetical protein
MAREITMNNSNRILNDAELDLVSGGVKDNPWSDYTNQQIAAQNQATGTWGGDIGGPLMPGGSHGGQIPAGL